MAKKTDKRSEPTKKLKKKGEIKSKELSEDELDEVSGGAMMPISNTLRAAPISNTLSATPISNTLRAAPISNTLSAMPISNTLKK